MSDTLRAAAQQALETLNIGRFRNEDVPTVEKTCDALRAALAEPTVKESLTVAGDTLPPLPPYIYGHECGRNERVFTADQMREYAAAALAAAEPDVPETRFGDMPERLRTYSADTELSDRYSDAMQEAADEIERLGAALAAAAAAAAAEPVAWTDEQAYHMGRGAYECSVLPANPSSKVKSFWNLTSIQQAGWVAKAAMLAAPPQREPLTDEQIDAGIEAWFTTGITTNEGKDRGHPFRQRMRAAIERARGIAPASAPKEQA